MKFETTRFGAIEVSSEEIYIFPDGPLGFPECTRFTFIDEEHTVPFRMLQSLDNPALAFVIVDPQAVRPDYTFQVSKDDLAQVKATDPAGLSVYAIVTMAKELKDVTVNLQGPLVVNAEKRLGHQFVLNTDEFTTRESIVSEAEVSESAAPVQNAGLKTKAG